MARRQFSRYNAKVGMFMVDHWPSHYNRTTGTYEFNPPKPTHRQVLVKEVINVKLHDDPYYAARGYTDCEFKCLTPDELLNAEMTNKNASIKSRQEQSRELTHRGYHGPVGGGEARVLKSLFTELGMPDLVKRGWFEHEVTVKRQPSRWQVRYANMNNLSLPTPTEVQAARIQLCYVFKSPMEDVHFSKFIRLCRMYRGDKVKLRGAVKAVLDNPEAHKEIETLDTLEILAGMPGME